MIGQVDPFHNLFHRVSRKSLIHNVELAWVIINKRRKKKDASKDARTRKKLHDTNDPIAIIEGNVNYLQ